MTVAVNVCGAPTGLLPFGPIVIFASTKRLIAGVLLAPTPFVERLTTSGVAGGCSVLSRGKLTDAEPVPVTSPAVWLVKVLLNSPLALVVPLNGPEGAVAPLLLASVIVADCPTAGPKPVTPSPSAMPSPVMS